MRFRFFAVAIILAGIAAGQTVKSTAATSCNRARLESFVNQYLGAMAAHNPFGLPLVAKIKFSENDQLLPLGDGLWNNVTGLGTYKLYASDPQSGQVGFFGTVKENGTPVAIALRLKIENRKIAEIESLVIRDAGAGAAVEALGKPDPSFQESVPAGERMSRKAMLAAADKYDDGIEQGNGDMIPFDPECNRVQNGVQTTNNPKLNATPGLSWNPLALGCKDQISTKFFNFIEAVYPRRPLVVDEERGLVLGFYMFQIPGDVKTVDSPGHGKIDLPAEELSPYFLDVSELFKFRKNKIWRIEALQTKLPYGTRSPFFNDEWRKARSQKTEVRRQKVDGR